MNTAIEIEATVSDLSYVPYVPFTTETLSESVLHFEADFGDEEDDC